MPGLISGKCAHWSICRIPNHVSMEEVEISVDATPEVVPSDRPPPDVPTVIEEGPLDEGLANSLRWRMVPKLTFPIGVSLSHLQLDYARQIAEFIDKNRTAFSRGEFDLGLCRLLPYDTQFRLPYRRVPPTQMSKVKQLLQDMVDQKIIRGSASPYASPEVFGEEVWSATVVNQLS
ncbi:putative transposon Ty3-I Gag-Pol polyprotein [Apostichopus japonicus]|uniref:Putative transposon Ty3-I Gag-Pol polyprotein n=1 Tax=Stichopus japonicus TaxID=307972 RepID=A0A2G8KP83_STIJA|nr:putative transposon Ty3-I Gag-Pol polyprotein [Apostichopus japonicus]